MDHKGHQAFTLAPRLSTLHRTQPTLMWSRAFSHHKLSQVIRNTESSSNPNPKYCHSRNNSSDDFNFGGESPRRLTNLRPPLKQQHPSGSGENASTGNSPAFEGLHKEEHRTHQQQIDEESHQTDNPPVAGPGYSRTHH